MSKNKAVIIATAGLTTELLYNSLSTEVDVTTVYITCPESKMTVIKRRIKKIGLSKTIGQVLFMVLVLPLISNRQGRINEIIQKAGFKQKPIPTDKITRIATIHDSDLANKINAQNPAIIFINGTRILKKAFLESLACPVVNIHVGITPKYRGVHGGYWALYNQDPALFGVTFHRVDKGIDTGSIIAQEIISVQKNDNFKTYPILQYCQGIQLAKTHLETVIKETDHNKESLTTESKLHYHPTIWNYLFGKTS